MRTVRLNEASRKELMEKLLKRGMGEHGEYEETVREMVYRVKEEGDKALFSYIHQFDCEKINESNIKVTEKEIEEAYQEVDKKFLEILKKALFNIRGYHEKQKRYSWFDTTPEGTMLGQKVTPLRAVGVYVPGGKAVYPSSVLMNIVPAKIAGVEKVVMATPCDKEGKVNPMVLTAAKEAGADEG